jgi:hypothetical protein
MMDGNDDDDDGDDDVIIVRDENVLIAIMIFHYTS